MVKSGIKNERLVYIQTYVTINNIDYYPYRVLCTKGMVITNQKHITQKKIEKNPGITLKKVIKYKDKWAREDGNREELQRPTEN